MLAALALLSQLLGLLILTPAIAAPMPAGVICHTGGDPAPDQAPAHHAADCALCPACLTPSLHAIGPTSPPLPMPAMASAAAALPPTRARPRTGFARLAPQARAPPASI